VQQLIHFTGWIESTAFSDWVRSAPSVFVFPMFLSCHTVGMGLSAGINAAIAFRILGAAPRVPIGEMRRFLPIMWFGFWLNFFSGIVLLIAYPTKALTNPVFYLKLTLVAAGVALVPIIRDRIETFPKGLAVASLVCWAGAITAGRLLAYTYRHLMADMGYIASLL
jgi:hypothetical protein